MNDNITAGMQALMARANKRTAEQRMMQSPEERDAADARETQKEADMEEAMRNAAIMQRLNNGYARMWWVWGKLATDHFVEVVRERGLDLGAMRVPYYGADIFRRIVGDDPDVFAMFRAMDREHRARYMDRMRAAPIPETIHPLMLIDTATGEFGPSAEAA